MPRRYLLNPDADLTVARGQALTLPGVDEAIRRTNDTILKFRDFPVDVFALLGMRNLSALVGEVFGASLVQTTRTLFRKNPHQDGYPDLLLMDAKGQAAWAALAGRSREKAPFSPFAEGGVEIKATCGSVPSAADLTRRGMEKPGLGDQRVALLTAYDWKAHHRDTNHLLGLFWDFMDGTPTVVAVFYSNQLTEVDWGAVVQPKAGGGRTTSVSILSRQGVQKMYQGWVACLNDPMYIDFFNRRNGQRLIPSR